MMKSIIDALAPALPWVLVLLVVFILFAVVFLFRRFSGTPQEAESARRAVDLELSMFARLVRLGRRKTDAVAAVAAAQDPNALTISKPIPAVPPPTNKP